MNIREIPEISLCFQTQSSESWGVSLFYIGLQDFYIRFFPLVIPVVFYSL